MKSLIAALGFMTRLPVPRIATDETHFAHSIRWFPAVGLIVGMIVSLAAFAAAHLDPWSGALAGLTAWVLVTGALHLDGLSDFADAAGATHKGRERLVVLADPHVGTFGAVAIGLQLIAKLILLHTLIERGQFLALMLIPFAARIGPLAWTLWLPPLHEGVAARFRGAIRPIHLALWTAPLAAVIYVLPAFAMTPILMAAWAVQIRRKLGGISGDGHGAGIELVETGLLASLVVIGCGP